MIKKYFKLYGSDLGQKALKIKPKKMKKKALKSS
jgi:hypothetical protein